MRKRNTTIITAYIIAIFTFLLFASIAYAQSDPPILPAFFHGKAAVNGRDVPVDSVIIAKIDNQIRGQTTVKVAGQYGDESGSTNDLAAIGSKSDIGKEISFYVKLQGIKEIQALQTIAFKSGVETKLDLTFIGDEVKEPVTSSSGSSSSSSSGGGGSGGAGGISSGGGGGAAVNTNQASFYYDLIEADKQIMITLSNPNIPIIRLQLIVNNDVSDVTFNFEALETVSNELDDVYKYIAINAPKINDNNIKAAVLRFKVPNSWLENYDPEKVKLMRFSNNRWNELTTVHEGSDANDNQYRAGTDGFSNFAIVSERTKQVVETKTITQEPSETEEEAQEIQKESKSAATGFAIKEIGANPIVGLSIIAVIVILGIALFLFFKEKSKGD